MRLILAGNPNSGKTTVFNHLTGSHQHIGNFPGVTVEFKSGFYGDIELIDLPGLYSLQPYSGEEAVAVEFLKRNPPDGIINCIDMTNLRRSLALTLSLMELKIPMILVANMLEECAPQPDLKKLEAWLNLPVFPIQKQNHWPPAALIRMMRAEIEHHRIPAAPCRGSMEFKYSWIDRHNPLPAADTGRRSLTRKIDRILLHPLWGTICFLLIMSGIFDLTFHRIGPLLTAPVMRGPARLAEMAELLPQPVIRALFQGAITGVGTVMSFLPVMMLLFFFLAVLEDSGYMVRICYLAENLMSALGLSGKSIVPLLIGFGCSVPAVLASRTMENTAHRNKTIRLIPFVSCSAKLPVYGILASLISPEHTFFILILIYLTGIAAGILVALFSPRQSLPLMMENPPYRLPRLKNLWYRLWGQTKSFVQKAFTILLLASIAATLLQQFTPAFRYTADPSQSLLAFLAGLPAPLFRPVHLDHWILLSALAAGLFAKESVVSVLLVLSPGLTVLNTANLLPFLAFTLFYPPCVAALTTIGEETRSRRFVIQTVLLHFAIAYVAALIAALIPLK